MKVNVSYQHKTFPMSAEGLKNQTVQLGPSKDEENPVFSPMELVLVSVAGCSSIDIVEILKKQRQDLEELQVNVEGKRANTVPAVFEHIHLHFSLKGALDAEKVTRAIDLSMNKYCSVSHMLKPKVTITTSFEIQTTGN